MTVVVLQHMYSTRHYSKIETCRGSLYFLVGRTYYSSSYDAVRPTHRTCIIRCSIALVATHIRILRGFNWMESNRYGWVQNRTLHRQAPTWLRRNDRTVWPGQSIVAGGYLCIDTKLRRCGAGKPGAGAAPQASTSTLYRTWDGTWYSTKWHTSTTSTPHTSRTPHAHLQQRRRR